MDRNEKLDVGTGATASPEGERTPAERPLDGADEKAVSRAAPPVGALGGAAGGAAAGTLIGGPIGTLVGAIAGALGGWWIGSAASSDIPYTTEDDEYFRAHYEGDAARLADRSYAEVRPVYQLGHVARHNPDYRGRDFEAVEADLRRGWTDDARRRYGEWDSVRHWVRAGYARDLRSARQASRAAAAEPADVAGAAGAEARDTAMEETVGGSGSWNADFAGQRHGYIDPAAGADMGGTESHHRATFSDPGPGFLDREVRFSDAPEADRPATGSEPSRRAPDAAHQPPKGDRH